MDRCLYGRIGAEPVSCLGNPLGRSAKDHGGKKSQKCHQSNIQHLHPHRAKLICVTPFGTTIPIKCSLCDAFDTSFLIFFFVFF